MSALPSVNGSSTGVWNTHGKNSLTTACMLNKNATRPFIQWIHSSTFLRIMCRQGGRYSAI
jgi:hypothetical protein